MEKTFEKLFYFNWNLVKNLNLKNLKIKRILNILNLKLLKFKNDIKLIFVSIIKAIYWVGLSKFVTISPSLLKSFK